MGGWACACLTRLSACGMLGPALAFILLLLQGHHSQAGFSSLESFDTDEPVTVTRPSGTSLQLRPNHTQTGAVAAEWKAVLHSREQNSVIVTWKNVSGSNNVHWKSSSHWKNRIDFRTEDFTLFINASQQPDSGVYILEVTSESGVTSRHKFNVSIFDLVGQPRLEEHWEPLDRGKCQVTLLCLVSRGGDVSYTWYRGRERIATPRNPSKLEEQIVPDNSSQMYTCNVSNPVSWANQTLKLTQGCLSAHQKLGLLPLLVIIVSLTTTVLLSALTCFCVWRRKRQPRPEEFLTIYQDVNNQSTRSNQQQRQEQGPPEEGSTIYSVILPQCSASTSQENENMTLYSVVLPSQKSGSKKKQHSPSVISTIYGEVGKVQTKAQNPA
ncbi:natural killer cell receptor 2B4 isoform X1 [Molossus molossus]|uniref:CD244 molecule n=1 Tax=Molossus molossus TaxID=27622 RepID=A0A7J8CPP2_MOLMO|nr:natural killer cell receptor 2B4 isoform X1 [Molossus molossus]KAF6412884.1 CD244 molecule [Molossus molossus]